ncbi:MAG TPA: nuclear transport factor 2 family protein [Solirubrobacteraceae bacterium]|jgi:ketosteroid isomerase-like protein
MSTDAESVARHVIEAFSAADLDGMRSQLDDDLHAYITNSRGGVDEVVGPDEYLRRVAAMDLASARFRVEITQSVAVRPDVAMVMVDVHAARGGRTLHNHAAHLLHTRDGKVSEWWMVEALPAESDAFWSS